MKLPVIQSDDDLYIQVQRNDGGLSVEQTVDQIFEEFQIPKLGGASGRGWSWYSTMQRCWYLYKKKYVEKRERGIPGKSLEVGSLVHVLLAVYYSMFIDETYPLTPDILYQKLIERGANPERIAEGWRIYEGYVNRYENDYFRPLAVEEFAEDPENGNTCRYDAIVEVTDPPPGMFAGTYVLEHKTASVFSADIIDGWRNDGEVIGQMMVWKKAGLDEKYGECQGVIVNLIGKQKQPKFERTIIPPQAWQLNAHERELGYWRAAEFMNRQTGTWPRSRANCITKYGFCDLFDHCSTSSDFGDDER